MSRTLVCFSLTTTTYCLSLYVSIKVLVLPEVPLELFPAGEFELVVAVGENVGLVLLLLFVGVPK